jgi:hypothetical protein
MVFCYAEQIFLKGLRHYCNGLLYTHLTRGGGGGGDTRRVKEERRQGEKGEGVGGERCRKKKEVEGKTRMNRKGRGYKRIEIEVIKE